MRDQVNIYRYTVTSDGAGGNIETRTLYRSNAWIDIEETTNTVVLSSGEYTKSRTFTATLRYRSDLPIQQNDIVEWKGLNLVVKEATLYNQDRNRFQTLTFNSDA
jgi:SPP1 family predicted phage head-tail adaptor